MSSKVPHLKRKTSGKEGGGEQRGGQGSPSPQQVRGGPGEGLEDFFSDALLDMDTSPSRRSSD